MTYTPDLHTPLTPWTHAERVAFIQAQNSIADERINRHMSGSVQVRDGVYTLQDAAEILGVSTRQVYRYVHAMGVGTKVSDGWRLRWEFTDADIDAMENRPAGLFRLAA